MKIWGRLLVVAHRVGPDIRGGAERHLWELVTRLHRQEGVACEIWSTTGLGLTPVTHWGVEMDTGYPEGDKKISLETDRGLPIDPIVVRRFPLDKTWKLKLARTGKAIQKQWEAEESKINPYQFLPYVDLPDDEVPLKDMQCFLLGPGWHSPEIQSDGAILRWTLPRFSLIQKGGTAGGTLRFKGFSPRQRSLEIKQNGKLLRHIKVQSNFDFTIDVPDPKKDGSVLSIECDGAFRPWKDHRSLGVLISKLVYRANGEGPEDQQSLWEDYRSLLRRRWENLLEFYTKRARERPAKFGRLFDFARGPRSSALWKALANPALSNEFGGVLAANLPWSIIPGVAQHCPLPMAALALCHLDDDFYYWYHYFQALREARVTLSNTRWAAEKVFPHMGVHSCWGGPGVDEKWANISSGTTRSQWRRSFRLDPEELVILSVGRKGPSKRYDILLAAIQEIRKTHPHTTLMLVGPDEDHRPIDQEGVIYTGAMDDESLHAAYVSADIFAMMSESESFGMVFVEAWMRGLPVVGNRWCKPVATLIKEGKDGFLASGVAETVRALTWLLDSKELREEFGRAGKEKTLRDHTWNAATKRVAEALREYVFKPA